MFERCSGNSKVSERERELRIESRSRRRTLSLKTSDSALMMLSKAGAGKNSAEGSSNGKLLNEVDTIRKGLYLDRKTSRNSSSSTNFRSQSVGKTHVPDAKSKLKGSNEEQERKEKKSLWGWKPLKAFSNVRNRRFNCCFTLQVHSIEGLPLVLNDLSLCVNWKRRDGALVTRPAKVHQRTAEFEEQLSYTCSIYGSRSGPHHSAKYEAKHFLLYASVDGEPEIDLGKQRVDLTRLLPLTLEELEEEKSSGKWTTSYKLSGRGKGAALNVSFGYTVIGNSSSTQGNQQNVSDTYNLKQNNPDPGKAEMQFGQSYGKSSILRTESLPSMPNQRSFPLSRSVENIKDLHEVLPISKPELDISVDLYKKFDEDKLVTSVDYKPVSDTFIEDVDPPNANLFSSCEHEKENCGNINEEFSVTEQGVEVSSNEQDKLEEDNLKDVDVISLFGPHVELNTDSLVPHEESIKLDCTVEEHNNCEDELVVSENSFEQNMSTRESLMKELESAMNCVSDLEIAALESPDDQESCMEANSDQSTREQKSISSDDDLVASEFLNMLGIEHSPFSLTSESEPDSPRELLLRKFEKEALADGCSLLNYDIFGGDLAGCGYSGSANSGWDSMADDFDLASAVLAAEEEYQMETMTGNSKTNVKQLEDLETEALMREWGLNETAFQNSPPSSSCGFGSPVHFPQEEPIELPPLGHGLGPFLQTKNGGFLRSMNPTVFKNAKSGGSLIMQVSNPVVVPAEMGSGIIEILQRLASVGMEKLSMQASKLMPLEDITGKTMHQVAWEVSPSLEGYDRQFLSENDTFVGQGTSSDRKIVEGKSHGLRSNKTSSASTSLGSEMGSEYVSLEDLAPLAMDKIEALSMEGLRIQSGQSDEEAPSNISSQAIGEFSTLQGKGINISGSLGLEGTGGLQLLDLKDGDDEVDGIMGLSLTLDEWMRLDSGELDDEDCISERTSRILAAHHANSLDTIRNGSKGERRKGRGSRKGGLLGNNFTVALMVQLRDPLRNYEPVGTPMLSLIQVERVFVPPKPRIYIKVSEIKNTNDDEDETQSSESKEVPKEEPKEEKAYEEEAIPQFRITDVHIAGVKTEPGRKLWGSSHQQKSGSRWLVANGMGKNNKHPFMKSKAAPNAKSTASSSSSSFSSPETVNVQPGDTLWSISSRVHGNGAKWKELAALNPHIRNPNVILPDKTIRLR